MKEVRMFFSSYGVMYTLKNLIQDKFKWFLKQPNHKNVP